MYMYITTSCSTSLSFQRHPCGHHHGSWSKQIANSEFTVLKLSILSPATQLDIHIPDDAVLPPTMRNIVRGHRDAPSSVKQDQVKEAINEAKECQTN